MPIRCGELDEIPFGKDLQCVWRVAVSSNCKDEVLTYFPNVDSESEEMMIVR